MTKNTTIPYGVASSEPSWGDTPWTKLATINEHLEAGEPIPPDLARWLGGAIAYANEDPKLLLARLGLSQGRGRKASESDAWKSWGRRVCELEDDGVSPEAALAQVLAESDNGVDEGLTRTKLQNLRNKYRRIWQEAHVGGNQD
jgi:hypothetical protein